jgi:hypothetical protein
MTRRCARVVALYEGAPGQGGCIGGHIWGTFSLANGGRSRQKMSDRSASLRTCSTTASGRQSFPRSARSPGSAETRTTLGLIQSRTGRWPDPCERGTARHLALSVRQGPHQLRHGGAVSFIRPEAVADQLLLGAAAFVAATQPAPPQLAPGAALRTQDARTRYASSGPGRPSSADTGS